jgi:hypothetical protein
MWISAHYIDSRNLQSQLCQNYSNVIGRIVLLCIQITKHIKGIHSMMVLCHVVMNEHTLSNWVFTLNLTLCSNCSLGTFPFPDLNVRGGATI